MAMKSFHPNQDFRKTGKLGPQFPIRVVHPLKCSAQAQVANLAAPNPRHLLSRRGLIASHVLGVGLLGIMDNADAAAQAPEVGTYLPPADIADFVLFVPDEKKTPALRAGTVDRNKPYRFALPSNWREGKVANIQSGNYCQPRCDEPWTEVIFSEPAEGRAAVLVSPLFRLTNKAQASIEEVGPPEGVIQSVGPFITGNYLDEEDIVSMDKKKLEDGRIYYLYEVNAPAALIGSHALASCTTKGDLALLFIVSANDKQWAKSESKLRKIVETFRA